MRERNPRARLIAELVVAGILAFPIPVLFWPAAVTILARIGVVALTALFVSGLAIVPIANYRRAIGKPLPLQFDRVLREF